MTTSTSLTPDSTGAEPRLLLNAGCGQSTRSRLPVCFQNAK